jgi:hypothetical protein
MEKKYCWYGNEAILHALNRLPRKIMSMKDKHNLVEFVLHELCNKHCFDITKAAYLIDNPDFDCMKGIAGFCDDECFDTDIWTAPDDFSNHMKQASFNQKVRGLQSRSCHRSDEGRTKALDSVAGNLGMQSYSICDIPMSHDNYGVFLYEQATEPDEKEQECLLNGISLLSFCSMY